MSKIISPKKRFRHWEWEIEGECHHTTVSHKLTNRQFADETARQLGVHISRIKIKKATN